MNRTPRSLTQVVFLVVISGLAGGMAQTRTFRPQAKASRKLHANASGSIFGPAQTFGAGFGGITQAVTADFNGDGNPDIAVVNPCSGPDCGTGYAAVVVMLGKGGGTFRQPVTYAAGSYQPMSIAAGDFNGDGVVDLAIASQCASSVSCGTGQVSVLLGNGDGTFQSPVPYATGTGASYFVATGDFNGDGILDLAVANQTSGNSTVAILLGNGNGTFQAPVPYATGAASAVYLAVGDFNLDGASDLAVINGGTQDSVSILLGNGDGTLQGAVVYASGGAFANGAAVADLNGDGAPDLAVVNSCATYTNLACSQSGSVAVLLGNGDGTFQAPVAYGSGGNQPNSVATADFDGDGMPDLAVGNIGPTGGGAGSVLGLLPGNGDGTFAPATSFIAGGSSAAFVSVADFNGDGQPDVALASQCPASGNCANSVEGILLNTATGFARFGSATSLVSSVNPAGSGQSVLLTATVNPSFDSGTPTGSVTFYDGGTVLSSVALSGAQAAYTASFPAAGPHYLQAVYTGDGNYAGSASPVTGETVGTGVSLTSSQNPSGVTHSVTFTATVEGSSPTATGSIQFMDGATLLSNVQMANGRASYSSSSLAAGDHSITAAYSGDANYAAGSGALTQSISQASTTALASSANPASTNQPVTFTATVTGPGGNVLSGAVAFMQGSPATTWGTAPVVNGQATITNAFSPANTYPITAVYLGSNDYVSSTSAALSQVVSGVQNVTTTTAIASSGSPSYVTQAVTFTATVKPSSGAIPDGEIVTFYNGADVLGTATTISGQAALTTSSLGVGTDSITATYAGDGTYQSSTSRVLTQIIKLNLTTTTVASGLNPAVYGQPITFTVTVAPQTGSGTPTGTVTLKNGSTNIGSPIALSNGGGSLTTTTLPAGPLSITASYNGDANFAAGSGALTQTVNPATTSTSLTSSPNPSSLNGIVTFTATVTGQYSGKVGGNVTFMQGSTLLGNASPVQGKATVTYAFSTIGTFPVTATYTGDTNDSGSTSNTLTQTVGNVSTTTTLISSGTPSYAGQTVTFTATVAPSGGTIPDGETVTFYDGSVSIGTGTTKSGIAALATTVLAVGTHTMTATYAGDGTYQTSTSKTLRQVVSLNNSITTLIPSANPSAYGQSVILTATVAAASGSLTPTGKVTFKNGSSPIASVGLVNGTAAYSSSTLAAGSLALSASYGGDANFASSSANLTQTVNQATTATTLTLSPNPSSLGQAVAFTATVTAQYSGAITGSVSFMDGSKTLGNATVTKGKATFSYAFTAGGVQSVTAVYGGDANNQASSSTIWSQTVTNATTTTTVTSSAPTSAIGQAVTFSATVTSPYGSIPDGETVTFYDSATAIGSGMTRSGVASTTTSTLTAGLHNVTATYAGDSSFASSTSKIFKQTVSQDSTNTVLTTSANPSPYGQALFLTATVTSTNTGGPTPTGTVSFKNGTTPLGTASLNAQGMAFFTTVSLGAGSYPITAAYSGDTASAKSTSAVLNQAVSVATTTTQIVSSVNPSAVGESVTFTAIVRSATAFPTGSVTFTAGSTNLGTATLVSGTAKLAVTSLPAGTNTVTATYTGSANVAASSGSILQYVE